MVSREKMKYDWVQILGPKTQQLMYINLLSGECCQNLPKNTQFKPLSSNQWWELYDSKSQRNYYYNGSSGERIWQKPLTGEIIPMANLQLLQQNLESSHANQSAHSKPQGHEIHHRDYSNHTLDVGMFRRSHQNSVGHTNPNANNTTHFHEHSNEAYHFSNNVPYHTNARPKQFSNSKFVADQYPVNVEATYNQNKAMHVHPIQPIEQHTLSHLTNQPIVFTKSSQQFHNLNMIECNNSPGTTISNSQPNTDAGLKDVRMLSNSQSHEFILRTKPPSVHSYTDDCHTNKKQVNARLDVHNASSNSNNDLDRGDLNGVHNPKATNTCCLSDKPVRRFNVTSTPTTDHYPESAGYQLYGLVEFPSTSVHRFHHKQADEEGQDDCHTSERHCSNVPLAESQHADKSADLSAFMQQSNAIHNNSSMYEDDGLKVETCNSFANFQSSHCDSKALDLHCSTLSSHSPSQCGPSRQRAFPRTNPTISRMNPLSCTTAPIVLRPNASFNHTASMQHSSTNGDSQVCCRRMYMNDDLVLIGDDGKCNEANSRQHNDDMAFASPMSSYQRQDVVANFNQMHLDDSPLSASLHTSSLSSPFGTFSSGSSATALTTGHSDDFEQNVPTSSHNYVSTSDEIFLSNINDESDDQLRPPTPPPRSASTLCSQGMAHAPFTGFPTNLSFDNAQYVTNGTNKMINHGPTHGFVPVANTGFQSFAGTTAAAAYPMAMYLGPVVGSEESTISSLTRNHPLRAVVIQPHHGRSQRMPYYTQHLSAASRPFQVEGIVHNQLKNDFTAFDLNDTFQSFQGQLQGSINHHALVVGPPNSCLLPNSTGIHYNNSWSGMALQAETKTTLDSLGSVIMQSNADANAKLHPSMMPRSASGGFAGPADNNDVHCSATTANSAHGSRDNNAVMQVSQQHEQRMHKPLVGFPNATQTVLVHPGHPAFAAFISTFDWPKHLFKADQDVAMLMSWTKAKFTKRLLISTDSGLKKQVAQLFKMIQSFMGDRKARLTSLDYGSIIIQLALNSVQLRDELYAQLCKQTSANSDIKSLTNGWALLGVCLYYFPPNSKFRDQLQVYLQVRSEAAMVSMPVVDSSLKAASVIASGLSPIAVTADVSCASTPAATTESRDQPKSYLAQSSLSVTSMTKSDLLLGLSKRHTAADFARVAPRWFARALSLGSRKFNGLSPSIEEICHVKEFLLKPCVFGSTLEEMMQIQAYRFPKLRLPWIQIFLTEELLRLNGHQTEGIFRLSPDMDILIDVRIQLEKLFEIFRVIQLCDPDPSKESSLPDRYLVHRHHPQGWSAFCNTFEPENDTADWKQKEPYAESQPLLAFDDMDTCENVWSLTGDFTWPVLPCPLSWPPAAFMLLTKRTHWPRSLAAMTRSTGLDAHLAAGLLKLWLRELAHPLVPEQLQPTCLKAACEAESYELAKDSTSEIHEEFASGNPIEKCCRLIRQIDLLPRRSLLYLILLLQHLVKPTNVSRTLMDARNFSTVIAPNLMRSSTAKDPRQMLEDLRPQTLFVNYLITHLDVRSEVQFLNSEAHDDIHQSNWDSIVHSSPAKVVVGPDNCFVPV